MRKQILLVVLLVSAMSMSAQKMYFGIGAGYHLPFASDQVGTTTGSDGSVTNNEGTFGTGIIPELRFGYMFSENWGLEFGFSYLMGSDVVLNQDLSLPLGATSYFDESYSKTTMFRLAPQLVFRTGNGIYSKFGVLLPLGGTTMGYRDVEVTSPLGTSVTSIETENHGYFSLGFIGTLGYAYSINDNIDLFGEIQFIGLTIYSKTQTITKYEVDGVDQLPGMTKIQIETEYVGTVEATDNTDPNQAWKAVTSSSPYSSFGINIGLAYKL
jgi:hypothetical protein